MCVLACYVEDLSEPGQKLIKSRARCIWLSQWLIYDGSLFVWHWQRGDIAQMWTLGMTIERTLDFYVSVPISGKVVETFLWFQEWLDLVNMGFMFFPRNDVL